jgi:hypothetical protein
MASLKLRMIAHHQEEAMIEGSRMREQLCCAILGHQILKAIWTPMTQQ